MSRITAILPALKADKRGAAVIETALLAPILGALLIGMVQLAQGFSAKLLLEQASQRAIEKVMNGQADKSTAAALRTEAANTAGVPESNVTVEAWLECDGTKQTDYDTSCSPGQVQKRYLSVSINKTFTPMFSTRLAGADANGSYTLTGQTSVRTQ